MRGSTVRSSTWCNRKVWYSIHLTLSQPLLKHINKLLPNRCLNLNSLKDQKFKKKKKTSAWSPKTTQRNKTHNNIHTIWSNRTISSELAWFGFRKVGTSHIRITLTLILQFNRPGTMSFTKSSDLSITTKQQRDLSRKFGNQMQRIGEWLQHY